MRILYLEDRLTKVSDVQTGVESLGHQLDVVTTTNAALAALETHEYGLILCALHLEWGSALDLVRTIKKHATLKDMPIILIDSHQTEFAQTVNECLAYACSQMGVNHYLAMKKFDSKQLCRSIQSILEESDSDQIEQEFLGARTAEEARP